jgi:CRISPR system Cascade subunit CasA
MKPSFNLWYEPWITGERRDGSLVELSLEHILLDVPALQAIHDPSPLVVIGIHRLLTAVLQDIFDPQSEDDLQAVWDAGCFSAAKINAFGEQYAQRFDLFSEDAPFLQSADIPLEPEKKTWNIALLFQELPTGTFVTHYQHGLASDHIFCPTCVARGLITIPAFASSGGRGIKPSVNGVPPIYVLPGGATLFEQLWASLMLPEFQPKAASITEDQVWWRRDPVVDYKGTVTEVSYLHSLTFPARRIRVHPQPMQGLCTRCGRRSKSTWGVRTMVYRMGESRPKDAPFWQDPFAAYRVRGKKGPTPIRPLEGKVLWREFAALFLPMTPKEGEKEHTLLPTVLYQRGEFAGEIGPDYDLFPVRCVGLRTDMKAKIFEWLDAGFDIPTSLLHDPLGSDEIRRGLEFATDCARTLAGVFRGAFSREGAEHHTDVKNRMLAAYWAALAAPFRDFVLGVAKEQTREQARITWVEAVVAEGNTAFAAAAESIGDSAIALHQQVEGIAKCRAALNARKKKTLGEA